MKTKSRAKESPMTMLQKAIDMPYEHGRLPLNIPLCSFRVLEKVAGDLEYGKRSIFMQDDVKKVLEYCGFYVRPYDLVNYIVER